MPLDDGSDVASVYVRLVVFSDVLKLGVEFGLRELLLQSRSEDGLVDAWEQRIDHEGSRSQQSDENP